MKYDALQYVFCPEFQRKFYQAQTKSGKNQISVGPLMRLAISSVSEN